MSLFIWYILHPCNSSMHIKTLVGQCYGNKSTNLKLPSPMPSSNIFEMTWTLTSSGNPTFDSMVQVVHFIIEVSAYVQTRWTPQYHYRNHSHRWVTLNRMDMVTSTMLESNACQTSMNQMKSLVRTDLSTCRFRTLHVLSHWRQKLRPTPFGFWPLPTGTYRSGS